MILYLDTSSLVKLYVLEEGSLKMRAMVAEATMLATSSIAQVEARAALARRLRTGEMGGEEYRAARALLNAGWDRFYLMDVSPLAIAAAGDCAERHPLRALDALHLASASLLQERVGEPVTFASADLRLCEAARQEGFAVA